MTVAAIEDLTQFVLDGTHSSPVRTERGVPVLSAQNVSEGRLDFETDRFTTAAEYDAFRRRLELRPGDVLLTIVGSIGRSAVVDEEVRPLVFQRSVAILRPQPEKLVSRFLYHAIQSDNFQSQLSRATNQSSQAGVYLGKLKGLKIPCPSLAEQRRIAEILDKADALRAKRRAALAQLDTLIQSIFLDMFGDRITILKRWPVYKLGDQLTFLTSGSRGWAEFYADDGDIFLRIQNVSKDELLTDEIARVKPPNTAEAARTRVIPADVLLSITADLGRTAVIPKDFPPAFINQHLAILRLTGVEPRFVSAFLSSPAGRLQVQNRNRQGVKAGLNFDDIRSFLIPVPPIDLQRAFVCAANSVDDLKRKARKSERAVSELFASLQHRAFRGEL